MQSPAANPPTSPTPSFAGRRRRRRATTLIVYLLLLCADVGFSHWDDFFGQDSCGLVKARHWYQRVVTLGYRKPRPHFVRLVLVAPRQDACEYRAFLSRLVDRIALSRPMMIVLDYSFSPHNCSSQTTSLQGSINSAGVQFPIVFGRLSSTLQEIEDAHKSDLADLQKAGFKNGDQAVWPSDIVWNGSSIVSGLYRLNCDTRRIPTYWPVFEKDNGRWVRDAHPMSTIALAAALLYDPTVLVRLRSKNNENPFTSFIPEKQFQPVEADSIVTANETSDDWHLARRIVVVGDEVRDPHNSVVGRVPGVVLQANYLESLLDDRYFHGLGAVMEVCVTFICLLIVGLVFDQTEKSSRALFRTAFFLLLLLLISYFSLVHVGKLFTFWAPCVPAVLLAYLEKLISEWRANP